MRARPVLARATPLTRPGVDRPDPRPRPQARPDADKDKGVGPAPPPYAAPEEAPLAPRPPRANRPGGGAISKALNQGPPPRPARRDGPVPPPPTPHNPIAPPRASAPPKAGGEGVRAKGRPVALRAMLSATKKAARVGATDTVVRVRPAALPPDPPVAIKAMAITGRTADALGARHRPRPRATAVEAP